MKFYNREESLYLETDALGDSLGDGLLQVEKKKYGLKDIAKDTFILRPTAFVSKKLSNADTHYSNIKSSTRHTKLIAEISLLLCQIGTSVYKPQATCINF